MVVSQLKPSSSCFSVSAFSQHDFSSSSSNYHPAVILPVNNHTKFIALSSFLFWSFSCFGYVCLVQGLGNNSGDYQKLQLTLKQYGIPNVVAKVSRLDWLRNAAGLLDPNYWRGTLRPRPVLDW